MYGDKNYYSLDYYLKKTFNTKIIKIALDAFLTCPNRDGTLSYDGCIFCSSRGSGDFTEQNKSITKQFEIYRDKVSSKWKDAKYIAYFQAFTNTYGNIDYLRKIYYEALSIKDVVGISIATRPDCLDDEVIELLSEISKKTFLMVELGFQTSKESSIKFINRCYENVVFEEAVTKLNNIGANIVVHTIIGLPNESESDILETIRYVCGFKINGIKLQLLHVLKNTNLQEFYLNNEFDVINFEEYVNIIVKIIKIVPPNIVIHRLTGDAKREDLIAPLYSLDKKRILNTINKTLKSNNIYQGMSFIFKI